jgi:hypothetical protein
MEERASAVAMASLHGICLVAVPMEEKGKKKMHSSGCMARESLRDLYVVYHRPYRDWRRCLER